MTISPLQFNNDHVTKGEFIEHKQYITDGFEKVFEQVDNVETIITSRIDVLELNMNKRFDGMDKKFDAIDQKFDAIDSKFDVIDSKFKVVDTKLDGLGIKINNITNLLTRNK